MMPVGTEGESPIHRCMFDLPLFLCHVCTGDHQPILHRPMEPARLRFGGSQIFGEGNDQRAWRMGSFFS